MVTARATPPASPAPTPDDCDPPLGCNAVGEERTALSYSIPQQLKQRVNGAGRFAGGTGHLYQVESQTDRVRLATHLYLTPIGEQHNHGCPFHAPASNARGRGADRADKWVQIGVNLPLSLHRRILGGAQFAADTGLIPGVSSANRFVVAALGAYLTGAEDQHNRGKPFTAPRCRLPTGGAPGC